MYDNKFLYSLYLIFNIYKIETYYNNQYIVTLINELLQNELRQNEFY